MTAIEIDWAIGDALGEVTPRQKYARELLVQATELTAAERLEWGDTIAWARRSA